MSITVIISWVLPIVVIMYLVAIISLVKKLKREQRLFWAEMGEPSMSDPSGQLSIISTLIFGKGCPENIASLYRTHILIVRALAILSLICFVLVWFLISAGAFDA